MKTQAYILNPSRRVSLEDVEKIALKNQKVKLSPQTKKKMLESRRYLERSVSKGETIYGVNTGFGASAQVSIPKEKLEKLQTHILLSHACGVGEPLDLPFVRAMLFLRAASLAQGFSACRPVVAERLLDFLNADICPVIPEQGSVGASGDLAPLAHLALVLIGEGEAFSGKNRISGAEALKKIKLEPLQLQMKEGLSLINGTQFMTALGVLTCTQALRLLNLANEISALSLEALHGTATAFDSKIHAVRAHEGQVEVAAQMRELLNFPRRSEIGRSHEGCDRVQDPYSLRCIPQVHGMSLDTLKFVEKILETEINSVTDNPLVFARSREVLSGGNFHGQYVAMALDFMAIALAELANISEQRIQKLLNPAFSSLPRFLIRDSGLNSGMMMVQVSAASLVSENKTLCHPASVDSIPTNVDKEDHVSMGAWAARKAHKVFVNVRRVLAMELLCATQGLDLLRPKRSTAALEKLFNKVRKQVPFAQQDRLFGQDILKIDDLLAKWTQGPS